MAFKLKGVVIEITPTQTFSSKSGNSYTSRYLVIQTIKFDRYTGKPTLDPENTPKFTFFGKQCEALDNVKFADVVIVSFDIQGKAYTNKDGKKDFFTEVRPFRVDVENAPVSQTQQPNGQSAPYPQQPPYPPQPQQYAPAPSQPPQAYQPPIQPNPTPFGQSMFPPAPNEVKGETPDLPF